MKDSLASQFRLHHLISLLEGYDQERSPIDCYVSYYFRQNKALGSKDRAYISEEVYRLVRWRDLADYVLQKEGRQLSWEERRAVLSNEEIERLQLRQDIPLHTKVSMPLELFRALCCSWGEEKATQLALASNTQAPTCVRVNASKISRDELLSRWQKQGYLVEPASESASGICFKKKIHFFSLQEFSDGLFEVQDEASQLVAALCTAAQGSWVLDFCSGSGGKTLAFAPLLQGTGQIFLHDIRKQALVEAKKRLKRAGIQNAQLVHSSDLQRLRSLKKKMDWVFVDAPCSGTGTLRRNPDMKWKFSDEMLERIVSEQRVIFEQALSYVKPCGHIVYATCSILRQENHEQVEHFLKTYPIEQVGPCFESIPEPEKKDGFFACVFRKKPAPQPLLVKKAYDEQTSSCSFVTSSPFECC